MSSIPRHRVEPGRSAPQAETASPAASALLEAPLEAPTGSSIDLSAYPPPIHMSNGEFHEIDPLSSASDNVTALYTPGQYIPAPQAEFLPSGEGPDQWIDVEPEVPDDLEFAHL